MSNINANSINSENITVTNLNVTSINGVPIDENCCNPIGFQCQNEDCQCPVYNSYSTSANSNPNIYYYY